MARPRGFPRPKISQLEVPTLARPSILTPLKMWNLIHFDPLGNQNPGRWAPKWLHDSGHLAQNAPSHPILKPVRSSKALLWRWYPEENAVRTPMAIFFDFFRLWRWWRTQFLLVFSLKRLDDVCSFLISLSQFFVALEFLSHAWDLIRGNRWKWLYYMDM